MRQEPKLRCCWPLARRYAEATIGVQGSAERFRPRGCRAKGPLKESSHWHFIRTANAFRRSLIFCKVFFEVRPIKRGVFERHRNDIDRLPACLVLQERISGIGKAEQKTHLRMNPAKTETMEGTSNLRRLIHTQGELNRGDRNTGRRVSFPGDKHARNDS